MNKNKHKIYFFRQFLLMVGVIISMSFVGMHEYYVSLAEIRIDTQKKTFNVSCKMFTDDLENALYKSKGKKIDFAKSTESKEAKALLFIYIKERFKVYADSKELSYQLIGFEMEDDATWCYLEMPKYKKTKKVTVINSLLFDYLPKQINVVQLYVDKDHKSHKLTNPEMNTEFEL